MRASRNKATRKERELGTSMLEYVLMVCLIAIACIMGIAKVGDGARDSFEELNLILNESMDIHKSNVPKGL